MFKPHSSNFGAVKHLSSLHDLKRTFFRLVKYVLIIPKEILLEIHLSMYVVKPMTFIPNHGNSQPHNLCDILFSYVLSVRLNELDQQSYYMSSIGVQRYPNVIDDLLELVLEVSVGFLFFMMPLIYCILWLCFTKHIFQAIKYVCRFKR